MVYGGWGDAYRDFRGLYARTGCCGRIHWGPEDLARRLLEETPWFGEGRHLSPALILRASRVAAQAQSAPLAAGLEPA
jgi:hypothetical protein